VLLINAQTTARNSFPALLAMKQPDSLILEGRLVCECISTGSFAQMPNLLSQEFCFVGFFFV
jgi:hypothetical protein